MFGCDDYRYHTHPQLAHARPSFNAKAREKRKVWNHMPFLSSDISMKRISIIRASRSTPPSARSNEYANNARNCGQRRGPANMEEISRSWNDMVQQDTMLNNQIRHELQYLGNYHINIITKFNPHHHHSSCSVFRRVSFNPSNPRKSALLAQVLNKLRNLRPCLVLQLFFGWAKHLLEDWHQLWCKLLYSGVVVLV